MHGGHWHRVRCEAQDGRVRPGPAVWGSLAAQGARLHRGAALTLALGIGANTVLSQRDQLRVLRPLTYPEPDRIVVMNETAPNFPAASVAWPNFLDWKAQSRGFSPGSPRRGARASTSPARESRSASSGAWPPRRCFP